MDARLNELATSLNLGDGGFRDTDAPLSQNWTTNWKVKTMVELLPHLYEPSRNKTRSRSSYGLKHDLEHLFQTYAPELSSLHTNWVGNGELILALAYLDYPSYDRSGLNAFYRLRDKRKGKGFKNGKGKKEADEAEASVKALLRKKVEEHLSAST